MHFEECRESKLPSNSISGGLNISYQHSFQRPTHFSILTLKYNVAAWNCGGNSSSAGRSGEKDRESESALTVALIRSRAARSINIPQLHRLYRSHSKRFSFVRAEKKSFRRDYATDTRGRRRSGLRAAARGETARKLVLHYKAGGPWQWGTPRAQVCER